MGYFLYMKQSIKRCFKPHFNLLVLFVCALILPFIFIIYRDSNIYGNKLSVEQITNNANYSVSNVNEKQAAYFVALDNFIVVHENNKVFLTNKNTIDSKKDTAEILEAIIMAGGMGENQSMMLNDLNGLYKSRSAVDFNLQMLILTFATMAISLLVVSIAYKAYLNNFTHEIGILEAIGASKKQIAQLFLVLLLIICVVGSAVSFAISYSVMYVLFNLFLEINEIEGLAWTVFNVNYLNIFIALLVIVSFTVVIYRKNFNKIFINTPEQLMKASVGNPTVKKRHKEISKQNSAGATIACILKKRTNNVYQSCFILSCVTFTILVFIMNYVSINLSVLNATASQKYDIYIKKMSTFEPHFNNEEMNFFSALSDVKDIKFDISQQFGEFLLPAKKQYNNHMTILNYGENQYIQIAIKPETLLGKPIDKGTVHINKNNIFADFKLGDSFNICKKPKDANGDSNLPVAMQTSFSVTELLDSPWSEGPVEIYFNTEDYNVLVTQANPSVVEIAFEKDADFAALSEELNLKFGSNRDVYAFVNNRLHAEVFHKTSIGFAILTSFIAVTIFFFIVIILYVLISGFINSQSENIRLFYVTGASKKQILRAYISQSFTMSALCLVSVLGLGSLLSIAFFSNSGYYLTANRFTVLSHLSISCVVLIAYNFPVYLGMKKQLKRTSFNV